MEGEVEGTTPQKWRRLTFNFYTDGKTWRIRGGFRSLRRMARTIFSALPIDAEALVFNKKEILIRLEESLRGTFSKEDRTHEATAGDIIYRPQLPAISIFAESSEIYESVEQIGKIWSDTVEKLKELCETVSSPIYLEMRSAEESSTEETS